MNIDVIVASVLRDAKAEGHDIRIYEDPNMGGLAWSREGSDYFESGPIGPDRDDYGTDTAYESIMSAVIRALVREGYTVVR